MSKLVKAAVQLDNVSTTWQARFTIREAREFCAEREVIYTYDLEKLIEFIAAVMDDKYYILNLGREGSRVLYLEWSPAMIKVSMDAFDSMRGIADEFDVTVDGAGWACLRVWWD